jgi:hypothetical protein
MLHVFNYGINYLKWIHVLRQKLSITRVCQQMSKVIFELSYYFAPFKTCKLVKLFFTAHVLIFINLAK